MKAVNFEYARPGDLPAAIALAANGDANVKLIAGGQSLGPMLNLRLLHEGELMRFFHLLEKQNVGAFDINQCVLQRTNLGAEPGAAQPNLRAECELAWVTLNPPQMDHKP